MSYERLHDFRINADEFIRLDAEISRLTAKLAEASKTIEAQSAAYQNVNDMLNAARIALAERDGLLDVAACPNADCGGQGYIARQVAAGEWEQEQCQWCYERAAALLGKP